MARKKENLVAAEDNKKSLGGKILAIAIIALIVLIWLSIFAVLVKLDVGGFGSSILRPLIKDIPVVNQILPKMPDEQIANENEYNYKTLKEANERIKELESENEILLNNGSETSERIKELEAEVSRLKEFEANQLEFEQRVLEFDKNVVFAEAAPDVSEYKKYYESINPDNAEEIYRQVVEQLKYSEAIQEKADIYRKMKPQDAAEILEKMTADIDLIAEMLLCMRPNESSLILSKMDRTQAAKITKKMFDMDAERLSSVSE